MRKLPLILLSALFTATSFSGIALTQATHPGMAAIARADDDRNGDRDDQGENRGNPHGCINPAGHERGWCKHNRGSYVTIAGTAIAINGDLAQFRQDNGAPITINQINLLRSGQGLQIGAHYVLQGYFSNNMFVAQSYGGYYGNNSPYPNNGYPYPGATASVHGIITAVSGDRLTIMQGLFSTVTINDQQALNNGTAQNLFIGRNVTAWGYWSGGTFYATSIG
jgi:hypothetical protein